MTEGDIKLYYFGAARGRAECIRMMLTAAGVQFEDVKVDHKDWFGDTSLKKEAPFGQMPFLIYKGKKIAQSIPIASFLAKKYGFYPTTDEEILREEEVLHLSNDFRFPHFRDWFWTKDQERIDAENRLKTQHFPRYLGYFEALLKENGGSGFFVGEKMTLADLMIADLMTTALGIDPEALKPFPLLQKLCTNVNTLPALQDYLANRPHMVI